MAAKKKKKKPTDAGKTKATKKEPVDAGQKTPTKKRSVDAGEEKGTKRTKAPAGSKEPTRKTKASAASAPAAKRPPAARDAAGGQAAAPSSTAPRETRTAPAAKKPAASSLAPLPLPLTSLPGAPVRRRAYGIVDVHGALLHPPTWELLGAFGDGLAAFRANTKTGYVDRRGVEVIAARFFMAQRFQEGRAVVRLEQGGKLGAIDTTGAVVIEPVFDALDGPHEGVFSARRGDRWGLVDRDGAELLPFEYDRLYGWSEGHMIVERGGRFGVVDRAGRVVLPVEHPPLYDLRDGLLGCELEAGNGYIDLSGEVVIPGPFDRFGPFCEGLALVSVGGRFGYVKRDGTWLVEPSLGDVTPRYGDEPHPGWFQEGCAVYTDSDETYGAVFGYLDRSGRRLTEPVFAEPRRMIEGRARVRADGGYGYVGPDGSLAIPARFAAAEDFHEGRARVGVAREGAPSAGWGKTAATYGFIDPTGAWVVEPRYEEAGDFAGGVARVKRDGRWGLIDRDGREVLAPEHHLVGIVAEGLVPVMSEGPDPEAEARELSRVNAALQVVVDDLAPTVRPFLRLTLEPIGDARLDAEGWWDAERLALGAGWLTASKLGGTPYVPRGADLPRDGEGEPLALLAQLDLAALPPLEGFPAAGLLQVFVAPDGAVAPDDLTSRDHVRVLHHADTAAPASDGVRELHRALPDFPVRSVARVTAELAAGPMTPDVPGFDRALSSKARKALGDERVNQGLYAVAQGTGHKLGGWPAFTQEDPRTEKRYRKYDTLLLQLDSDDVVQWGDAGIANVFVPAAALAAGELDDVLFTSDSL